MAKNQSPKKQQSPKPLQTVVVLEYHHRFGTDVSVYTDVEAAKLGIASIMAESIEEVEDPVDRERLREAVEAGNMVKAGEMWSELCDENFEYSSCEVLDADTLRKELKRES